MGFDRDFELAVRAWVSEGSERLPDPALVGALREIARTPQRRWGWRPRAFDLLETTRLPLAAAAVTIAVAVVVGLTLTPDYLAGPTTAPSAGPTPSATLAPEETRPIPTPTSPPVTEVSGRFTAVFGAVEIAATLRSPRPSGSMEVSMSTRRHFSVDIRCAMTTDTGLILIGGPVLDSTDPDTAVGNRVALAIQPGEVVTAILWFEGRRRATGCAMFLERVPDEVGTFLQPIEGDVEFGTTARG